MLSKLNYIKGNSAVGSNVAQDGDWVYYVNRDDESKLYKIRTDGTGRTKLSDDKCADVNVVDDWIYYTITGFLKNKLYKIHTDGTGRTELFEKAGYRFNAFGHWIYYENNSDGYLRLYKARTDGTERQLLDAVNVITITYKGIEIQFDELPIIINDRVLAPLSTIEKMLDVQIEWDDEEQSIDVPPTIINGQVFIPVRYYAERLGFNVYWNEVRQSVAIYN